jgi:menaquinone-dependent protoporphyrinogen IX oxidase
MNANFQTLVVEKENKVWKDLIKKEKTELERKPSMCLILVGGMYTNTNT